MSRYRTGDRKRWPPVSLISKVGVVELLNLPTGGIIHYYRKSGPDAVGEHIVVCFRKFSLYNHITRSVVRDHYNLNIFRSNIFFDSKFLKTFFKNDLLLVNKTSNQKHIRGVIFVLVSLTLSRSSFLVLPVLGVGWVGGE